ncbi:glycosyltransferase family 88 protein, partial [Legionella sp.]|uniref:glycosyltransferase family 88 protein n=1 Tax=Legionella sp. TaxID=459 RepID=UPI003C8006AA
MSISSYTYNPHRHTKIWLSKKPNLFMNLENQVRLLEMREKNPNDEINLVYDSTLLTREATEELETFCDENRILSVDAALFANLTLTKKEYTLLNFYKDEMRNLNKGGNLAVASDILRWISPLYERGTYTDFDFPIDTSKLPPVIKVAAPLLLNIGSLKIGKQEFILVNNDFVAIVDPKAAKEQLEYVQSGIIERLTHYGTDFVERINEQLQNNFFNRYVIKFMKNRPEAFYISQSKEIDQDLISSRDLRNHIRQIMSDKDKFLDFNRKSPTESSNETIQRLKEELQKKLTLVKYLFFGQEYTEIKNILQKDNEAILEYLMKKEFNIYLKSIVVCTT